MYGDKGGVYCESKVFGSEEFGYNKIVVERPLRYNYSTAEERIQRLKEPDVLDDLRGGVKSMIPRIFSGKQPFAI